VALTLVDVEVADVHAELVTARMELSTDVGQRNATSHARDGGGGVGEDGG
jgi:hypothetical protein